MVDFQQLASRVLLATATGGRKPLSILIYHRVLTERDWMLPDVPTADEFRWQMKLMKRHFNLLPLTDAVRLLGEGRLPARAACITFDDGYADTATVAYPILAELGIPMTIFVASGYLEGGMMWNDVILESVRRLEASELDLQDIGLPRYSLATKTDKQRAAYDLMVRCKYLETPERQDVAHYLARRAVSALPHTLMMTHAQIRSLAERGVEMGGHTLNHPILTKLSPEEAQAEIVDGKTHLEDIIGQPVRLFAYPNGQAGVDYNNAHIRMVQQAGFEAAVTTDRGVSDQRTDLFQLPRYTPWAKSGSRFLLRMALNSRVRLK